MDLYLASSERTRKENYEKIQRRDRKVYRRASG